MRTVFGRNVPGFHRHKIHGVTLAEDKKKRRAVAGRRFGAWRCDSPRDQSRGLVARVSGCEQQAEVAGADDTVPGQIAFWIVRATPA